VRRNGFVLVEKGKPDSVVLKGTRFFMPGLGEDGATLVDGVAPSEEPP